MNERASKNLDSFFRHLGDERRLSPLTISNYRRDLSQCMTYCDEAGIADWTRLTTAEVRGWVSALHRQGLSGKASSAYFLLCALSTGIFCANKSSRAIPRVVSVRPNQRAAFPPR
jgi:site-specific recombinase XerC